MFFILKVYNKITNKYKKEVAQVDYIERYFEVEWIQIEMDDEKNEKEIVYKEEFNEFSNALEAYIKKKEEGIYIVRLLSLIMETKKNKN